MKDFLVQLGGTDPAAWRTFTAPDMHAAIVEALKADGFPDDPRWPTEAYVAIGTARHANGAPVMVQSFRLDYDARCVTLPDGYNGSTMSFHRKPIERDGHLVKLQCAEPGKGHLITWARLEDLVPAMETGEKALLEKK
jgi:hypothetical protein